MSVNKSQWCAMGLALALMNSGCSGPGSSESRGQRLGFVRPLPQTDEYHPLLTRADTLALRSGLVTLQPGESCGWHSTEDYEEMIICLAGAGELQSEGAAPRPMSAGQYAYNPPWTRHNVRNTGTENMRYIYVVAPTRPQSDHRHGSSTQAPQTSSQPH